MLEDIPKDIINNIKGIPILITDINESNLKIYNKW